MLNREILEKYRGKLLQRTKNLTYSHVNTQIKKNDTIHVFKFKNLQEDLENIKPNAMAGTC